MYEYFVPIPPEYYTRSGNTITITNAIESESMQGNYPVAFEGQQFYAEYTYTKTTLNPLGGIGEALIKAMNPVHILYECLTNREWGRGLPRTRLLASAWEYAAQKCFIEQFGLCMRWVRQDEIKSFIQSVLDHVGGVLYDDRLTGKIAIKLIRDDYDKSKLQFFDKDSGLLEITDASLPVLGYVINEMRIVFRDPVTDEDRTVRAVNLAALQAAGVSINSMTREYRGIPTAELASRIAKRDLRAASPAIRRFSIVLDRRGYYVTPGDVIRVQDLSRGIPDMVLRVGTIDYGRLGDGKIKIEALQDVFGFPQRGFTVIGPPTYVPPPSTACVGLVKAFEMPYRSVYRSKTPAEMAYVDSTSAFMATVVQEGKPTNASFAIAVKSGAPALDENPPDSSYNCGT